MSVIDEKQEAIAHVRMAVDNEKLARLSRDMEKECEIEEDSIDSQPWRFGSPEGKKVNLRVISAELACQYEEYRHLDERVRDFIACHMPEEAMCYEDDIHVRLSLKAETVLIYLSCHSGSALQIRVSEIPVEG